MSDKMNMPEVVNHDGQVAMALDGPLRLAYTKYMEALRALSSTDDILNGNFDVEKEFHLSRCIERILNLMKLKDVLEGKYDDDFGIGDKDVKWEIKIKWDGGEQSPQN